MASIWSCSIHRITVICVLIFFFARCSRTEAQRKAFRQLHVATKSYPGGIIG